MTERIDIKGKIIKRASAGVAVSALVLACGDSGGNGGTGGNGGAGGSPPADDCASFAGSYEVTTEIVSTDCPAGLHVVTQPVFWTFTQSAPSCDFTMSNSLYPSSQYTGRFTMSGSQAKVTWTSVEPAPIAGGHALTYTSENLTIVPAASPAPATLSGSFDWNSAYPCTGTTNVCHGSIAAGCPTPN